MSESVFLFLAGQTIIGVVTAIGIYIGITRQLTRAETRLDGIVEKVELNRTNHRDLEVKVNGISRTVERHSTILSYGDHNH